MAADVPAPLAEALRGRYELERELGRGGMATVYLATDSRHRRKVALKVLRPELAHAIGVERFTREIDIAAGLQHPNILPVFDSGESAPWLWYVMPYIEGETLRQRLGREGRLRLDDVLAITREVADALGYAHAHGIVHRDIKPENILLSGYPPRDPGAAGRCHALVADFGIARAAAEGREPGESLTATGVLIGTPRYMSPEQASGQRDIDGRSDLYALGCVVYEMLEGAPPFTGATPAAIFAGHMFGRARPVGANRQEVPAAVADAVMRALEKDPAKRFSTAEDFLAELTHGASTGGFLARAARRIRVTLGRRAAAIGLATVALVGSVSAGWWYHRGAAAPALAGAGAIAVLPFVDRSDSAGGGYLADGVTEDVIRALTTTPGLRVARHGARPPGVGAAIDARTVGAQLSVGAVLEGMVERVADSIRITAQLVSTRDNDTVWAGSLQRHASELAHTEEQLTRAVLGALRREPGSSARLRLTESGQAHDLYLQGRFYFNRDNVEDIREAISYFDRALTFDPKFALAYAGLSESYYQLSTRLLTPAEAMPKARAAAHRALEFDSSLAEAHVALSNVQAYFDFDWAAAERSLRQAIALSPADAAIRKSYGVLLTMLGRFPEAEAELDRASELDPLSSSIAVTASWPLLLGHREAEAATRLERAVAADPNLHLDGLLGEAHALAGHLAAALPLLEANRAAHGDARYFAALARVYVALGRRKDALAIRDELLARAQEGSYSNCYMLAIVDDVVGDRAAALASLERCMAVRNENVILLKVDPEFGAAIRAEPRYQALLRRLRFP